MTIKIEGTTAYLYQGDSGIMPFNNLQPGMLVYFGVYNKKRQLMFPEMHKIVDENGYVDFKITKEMSDLLTVKIDERYADYYYGLKHVDIEEDEENTIFLGVNPRYEDKYILRVYPKKAEGII